MIRRIVTIVILVSIVLMAAIFASLNTEVISVDFMFARYSLPQSMVIIGALVLGTLIGLLCASLFLLRVLAERRRLRKALRVAETEVSSLRSLPLHNAD